MIVHPAAAEFPMMGAAQLADLAEDIRQNGQRAPIVLHEGVLLDGRNRLAACDLLGIAPVTTEWDGAGESIVSFIVSINLKRRNLNDGQLAMIGAAMVPLYAEEARERQREAGELYGEGHPKQTTPEVGATWRQPLDAGSEEPAPSTDADFAELFETSAPETPQAEPAAGAVAKKKNSPKKRAPKAADQAAKDTGASGRSVERAGRVRKAAPDLADGVRAGTITLGAAEYQLRERQKAVEAANRPPPPSVEERIEVADATRLPLPDSAVELIVTSPPYGLDKPYDGITDVAAGWRQFMEAWLAEAYRVTVTNGRLALNVPLDTSEPTYRPTYVDAVQAALAAGWTYRTCLVWNKASGTKGNRGLGSLDSADAPHPIAQVEMIALFSKGAWKRTSDRPSDVTHQEFQEWGNGLWSFPGETKRWDDHPAPFPTELPRRLIKYLSHVGDRVLDPFCGSGTTVLVAKDLKREGIGFDQSEMYIQSARRRIAQTLDKLGGL